MKINAVNKPYIRLLIFLLLTLFVVQAHAGLFGGAKVQKQIAYEVLDSKLENIDALPIAQTNALLALDAAMRGVKTKKIKKVLNVEILGDQVDAIKEVIAKLSVQNVVIDNIGGTESAQTPFSGVMTLADDVGRSIQIGFLMLISPISSGHEVQIVNLNPSFWGAPNMEVFIVEDSAVDASTATVVKDYKGLYKNITSKSLSSSAYPSGKSKYIAVIFFKNLIAPNVKVSVKISSERSGLNGSSDDNYFQVFDGGWIVAVTSYNGDLKNDLQWLKITMQTDVTSYPMMSSDERLVGLFPLGRI